MKKLILGIALVLGTGNFSISNAATDPYWGSLGCVPGNNLYTWDIGAQRQALYNARPKNVNMIQPPKSIKHGPGSPVYESYKTCAQQIGQTPAPVLWEYNGI